MKLTPRLHSAIDLAANLHRDHVRKGFEKTPYVTHLFGVATILDHYGADEETIVAGLMHDTVEDIPEFTFDRLEELCGKRVRSLVEPLTEPRQFIHGEIGEEKWYTAKNMYLEQISNSPREVRMISAADKIHNMNSAIRGVKHEQNSLLNHFVQSALEKQVWFISELSVHLKDHIPDEMYREFSLCLEELKTLSEAKNSK